MEPAERDNRITGRNGFNIQKHWENGKTPYLFAGCQIRGLPNYFMMMGPQSCQPHGPGSVTYGEHQVELVWLGFSPYP